MGRSNAKLRAMADAVAEYLSSQPLYLGDSNDPGVEPVLVTEAQINKASERIVAAIASSPVLPTEEVEVVLHYLSTDTNFEGDYVDVEVKDEDGNVMAAYESDAIEHGKEAIQGFVKGLEYAKQSPLTVGVTRVADR